MFVVGDDVDDDDDDNGWFGEKIRYLYILGWSCEVFLKGRCCPKTWLLRWKMCALVVQMDVYVCVACVEREVKGGGRRK